MKPHKIRIPKGVMIRVPDYKPLIRAILRFAVEMKGGGASIQYKEKK